MSHPPAQDHIEVNRALHVVFPSQDTHRAISRRDWARLKRMIKECPVQTRVTEIVYSIAFAIAVSAGLTIIPLFMTQGRPAWVIPTYIITTVVSAAVGVVFVVLDKQNKTVTTDYLGLIGTDMEEIEASFVEPAPATAPSGVTPPPRGLQDLMADKGIARRVGTALEGSGPGTLALAQDVERFRLQYRKDRPLPPPIGGGQPPPDKEPPKR